MKRNENRVLAGIYESSMMISLMTMVIVALLEVFMLIYSMVDTALFGPFLRTYRMFYKALLALAPAYIAVSMYAKGNIERRSGLLRIANPVIGSFFYAWSLGIIWFDAAKYGTVDSAVFMTFSLAVPLSIYMPWKVYTLIVLIADAALLYITVTVSGSTGQLINLGVFFIIQIVLGISFLRLKRNLSERIVREQESAIRDAMTGFYNRRAYKEDLERTGAEPDFVYVAIDSAEPGDTIVLTGDVTAGESDTALIPLSKALEHTRACREIGQLRFSNIHVDYGIHYSIFQGGKSRMNGEAYEFAVETSAGRLLEWKRDQRSCG